MTLIRIGVPFSGLTKVRVKKTGKLEKRKYAVYQCYCGKRIILLCKQEEVQQSCGCLIKDLRREEQTVPLILEYIQYIEALNKDA